MTAELGIKLQISWTGIWGDNLIALLMRCIPVVYGIIDSKQRHHGFIFGIKAVVMPADKVYIFVCGSYLWYTK